MKKQYIKPAMKVYELQSHAQILVGSYPSDWNGPVGYAPGADDEKHLASVRGVTEGRFVIPLTRCYAPRKEISVLD